MQEDHAKQTLKDNLTKQLRIGTWVPGNKSNALEISDAIEALIDLKIKRLRKDLLSHIRGEIDLDPDKNVDDDASSKPE